MTTPLFDDSIPSLVSNPSLERSVSTPRAGAAVPLLGCTPGTSISGFRAAAQFNR